MAVVREYVDDQGVRPFGEWFSALSDQAGAAKIAAALDRMTRGNLGDVKSAGGGVQEWRIDFGPGYRLYFGRDGDLLIVLLAAGTKRTQKKDIEEAQRRWKAYKRRKAEGE